jgi:hypothetical protein
MLTAAAEVSHSMTLPLLLLLLQCLTRTACTASQARTAHMQGPQAHTQGPQVVTQGVTQAWTLMATPSCHMLAPLVHRAWPSCLLVSCWAVAVLAVV